MDQVQQQVTNPRVSFTRPNDTTAYADGDVIGDSTSAITTLKFPRAGFGGVVRNAVLTSKAIPGTKLNADLWLLDSAPENAYGNDNEAFALNDADVDKVVGVIALDGTTAANVKVSTANYVVIAQSLAIGYRKRTSSAALREDATLYGILVARNAYTPAAQEVITLKLGIEQG